MQNDAKKHHEELLAFLADHPESTVSDSVSDARNSWLGGSSISLPMLPGCPKIFHGRERELDDVVHILLQDAPRVAILGTGGMGKTSLATAALHHPDVSVKYANRYFIGCHSTPSCTELLSTIASHIGLDKGLRLSERIYGYFLYSPASLLILDNLETPWEPINLRSEVEEFLSLLSDIPQLAVLITMRGSERPGKVRWTRPFLEPLKPLPDSAALETFLAIADDHGGEDSISRLLNLTGNLPLAVTLMASVAAHEGCSTTLSRWNSENTQLLSDGYDQQSSLDISIMLSFSSARMTPAAQDLLAVLSMLPEGLSEKDIIDSRLPIPNIFTCKATLIRTALAYTDNTGRLKTLVPIQEHIRRIHPLSQILRLPLRQHFHQLIGLGVAAAVPSSDDVVNQITSALGNFNAVLLDGLEQDDPDILQTMQSILYLNRFSRITNRAWSPLMLTLGLNIKPWRQDRIYGQYLVERFTSCSEYPLSDAESQISAGHQYFEARSNLEKAGWYNALAIYYGSIGIGEPSKALAAHKSAFSLASTDGETTGPNTEGALALRGIGTILSQTGYHVEAHQYAKRAEQYAEFLGDVHTQAVAISLQVHIAMSLGDFRTAQQLCVKGADLLKECGFQGGVQDLILRARQAEIHWLKTEDIESRQLNASIAHLKIPGGGFTLTTTFAHHNLAVLDIVLGAPAELVLTNLSLAREQFTMARWPLTTPRCDATRADLHLREGEIAQAKGMFERSYAALQYKSTEAAGFCLERLADISHGMNGLHETMVWAAVYLASACKTRNKLALVKALYCFGNIFAAFDDDDSALSLLRIAFDGFTFMEIHRWRAKCVSSMTCIMD
ncbi:hypothetical protein C8R44DRAFT_118563 [Mycena epipterygia]|nr:hypothetical protein C8R44DRAFT_118563 [Mycena epipterygia]